jgi:hypothetical protein
LAAKLAGGGASPVRAHAVGRFRFTDGRPLHAESP